MQDKGVIKKTHFDTVFDIVTTTLLVLALLIVLYPMYFVVIASVSDATSIASGRVLLLPRNVSCELPLT